MTPNGREHLKEFSIKVFQSNKGNEKTGTKVPKQQQQKKCFSMDNILLLLCYPLTYNCQNIMYKSAFISQFIHFYIYYTDPILDKRAVLSLSRF